MAMAAEASTEVLKVDEGYEGEIATVVIVRRRNMADAFDLPQPPLSSAILSACLPAESSACLPILTSSTFNSRNSTP